MIGEVISGLLELSRALRPVARMVEFGVGVLYWSDKIDPIVMPFVLAVAMYGGIVMGVLETSLENRWRKDV
ncbi:MAG: hypothetical protein KatS3mg087_1123 [Patescibacteria group bacterium]|nr:MAG: hypothetical protein KatS3mg087_1123 [Patescibacteria group bacterium]